MGGSGTTTPKDPVKRLKSSLAALLVIAAASCGGGQANQDEPGRETVRGVVLEVKGDLTSIESFVIRTDSGEILEVTPSPEGDFRFPLPHLHDHRRTSEPVLVELDRTVDPPLATAIRDAENPAWHAAGLPGEWSNPARSTERMEMS